MRCYTLTGTRRYVLPSFTITRAPFARFLRGTRARIVCDLTCEPSDLRLANTRPHSHAYHTSRLPVLLVLTRDF
jgi:hypothetical protein